MLPMPISTAAESLSANIVVPFRLDEALLIYFYNKFMYNYVIIILILMKIVRSF